ncbi:hypothetical protein VTK26DRAFT_3199 [Humicola hyalothermophila]
MEHLTEDEKRRLAKFNKEDQAKILKLLKDKKNPPPLPEGTPVSIDDNESKNARCEEIEKSVISRYLAGQPFYTEENLKLMTETVNTLSSKLAFTKLAEPRYEPNGLGIQHDGKSRRLSMFLGAAGEKMRQAPIAVRFRSVLNVLDICTTRKFQFTEPANVDEPFLMFSIARAEGDELDEPFTANPEAAELFENSAKMWKESPAGSAELANIISAHRVPRVTKIIAFGLGLCCGEPKLCTSHRIQHQAVLTLRQLLEKKMGHKIEVYAQDPSYMPEDQDMLKNYGIEADTHTSAGFLKVDGETVVVSIGPNVPVKQIIGDLIIEDPTKKPAMIIWDNELYRPQYAEFWTKYKEPDYPKLYVDF